ncbi:MAG: murein biosynthesis integral membrane protein MurJ [Desulfohalobiaceae bacterium]
MDGRSQTIARNASVVAGATLASRVLGFVRDVIIAGVLGAGPMADAFFVAFRIPNLLRRLFAEGSLTMAFVPVFTRTLRDRGREAAYTLGRSTLAWLLLILGLLTLAALVLAEPMTLLIAPGFTTESEVFAHTVSLVRICFPYIVFISAMALSMGILNSMGHFLMPALAPCLLNLSLIGFGTGAYLLGFSVSTALAWGVLAAGLGQWMLLQPALSRKGFSWRGGWSLTDPGVRRVGVLMLPTVLGAAVYQVNVVLGTVLASFLAQGSISYLYYADRLVQFPLGVFGVAVSTAALPSLSSLASPEQRGEFLKTVRLSLNLTLFISLPATAGLIALNTPIVQVLFGRGEFGEAAVSSTAWALAGYGVGLPAFCCIRSLVSAFYALEDTRTPVLVAIVCLGLYLVTGLWLMGPLDHVGLALATSVSSWANVLLLGWLLRRRFGPWYVWGSKGWKMLGLSLALFGLCLSTADLGWVALVLIPAWAGLYAWLGLAMGIKEAELFVNGFRQMVRRKG